MKMYVATIVPLENMIAASKKYTKQKSSGQHREPHRIKGQLVRASNDPESLLDWIDKTAGPDDYVVLPRRWRPRSRKRKR